VFFFVSSVFSVDPLFFIRVCLRGSRFGSLGARSIDRNQVLGPVDFSPETNLIS